MKGRRRTAGSGTHHVGGAVLLHGHDQVLQRVDLRVAVVDADRSDGEAETARPFADDDWLPGAAAAAAQALVPRGARLALRRRLGGNGQLIGGRRLLHGHGRGHGARARRVRPRTAGGVQHERRHGLHAGPAACGGRTTQRSRRTRLGAVPARSALHEARVHHQSRRLAALADFVHGEPRHTAGRGLGGGERPTERDRLWGGGGLAIQVGAEGGVVSQRAVQRELQARVRQLRAQGVRAGHADRRGGAHGPPRRLQRLARHPRGQGGA